MERFDNRWKIWSIATLFSLVLRFLISTFILTGLQRRRGSQPDRSNNQMSPKSEVGHSILDISPLDSPPADFFLKSVKQIFDIDDTGKRRTHIVAWLDRLERRG